MIAQLPFLWLVTSTGGTQHGAVRVIGAAAVARPDVELPVGAELDRPSVVVGLLPVWKADHVASAGGDGDIGVRGAGELRDANVAVHRCEVHVEAPRPEIVGRELHGEHATLSSAYRHLLRDVEERTSELPPSVEDADYAVPLDHEEPAAARRPRYERRGGELPNLDEPHPGRTRGQAHRGTA